MQEILLKDAIELKVPARQNMMLVLRLTTAGVVARAGLTVDRLDDVKLAVEEACSCLIDSENPPERICLRFSQEESNLVIRICGDGCCEETDMDEDEANVVRCILEALVDGVEFDMCNSRICAIELRSNLV